MYIAPDAGLIISPNLQRIRDDGADVSPEM